jgi:hypothetical protein
VLRNPKTVAAWRSGRDATRSTISPRPSPTRSCANASLPPKNSDTRSAVAMSMTQPGQHAGRSARRRGHGRRSPPDMGSQPRRSQRSCGRSADRRDNVGDLNTLAASSSPRKARTSASASFATVLTGFFVAHQSASCAGNEGESCEAGAEAACCEEDKGRRNRVASRSDEPSGRMMNTNPTNASHTTTRQAATAIAGRSIVCSPPRGCGACERSRLLRRTRAQARCVGHATLRVGCVSSCGSTDKARRFRRIEGSKVHQRRGSRSRMA